MNSVTTSLPTHPRKLVYYMQYSSEIIPMLQFYL